MRIWLFVLFILSSCSHGSGWRYPQERIPDEIIPELQLLSTSPTLSKETRSYLDGLIYQDCAYKEMDKPDMTNLKKCFDTRIK